jgi:hypothetical protein
LRIGNTCGVALRHAEPRPVKRCHALVLPMVPVGGGGFLLAVFFTGFLVALLAGFFVGMRDSPLYW